MCIVNGLLSDQTTPRPCQKCSCYDIKLSTFGSLSTGIKKKKIKQHQPTKRAQKCEGCCQKLFSKPMIQGGAIFLLRSKSSLTDFFFLINSHCL